MTPHPHGRIFFFLPRWAAFLWAAKAVGLIMFPSHVTGTTESYPGWAFVIHLPVADGVDTNIVVMGHKSSYGNQFPTLAGVTIALSSSDKAEAALSNFILPSPSKSGARPTVRSHLGCCGWWSQGWGEEYVSSCFPASQPLPVVCSLSPVLLRAPPPELLSSSGEHLHFLFYLRGRGESCAVLKKRTKQNNINITAFTLSYNSSLNYLSNEY